MKKNLKSYAGFLKSLGPGLLWAGAAIGVSHLVQSTRAGANYGFALVGIVILANIFKYPFFEFGPRYAAATGESLLEGYRRLGKWALGLFLVLTFVTMFAIQAAVTVVTAGIISWLTGTSFSLLVWSLLLLLVAMVVLSIGQYPLLDKMVKVIIVLLTLTTVAAVIAAVSKQGLTPGGSLPPPPLWNIAGISFMIALMGWMPSAIDISVWSSIWTLERSKQTGYKPKLKEALFDFNLGYFGTAIIALFFLTLGALVMFGSGEAPAAGGVAFSHQFINLYTQSIGPWSKYIVAAAALATMFSTTLTCLDAFPRVLKRATEIVFPQLKQPENRQWLYWSWMAVLVTGTILLLSLLKGGMTFMVDMATTLSFMTAPILAIINYKVITGPNMPQEALPPRWMKTLSIAGIIFLSGFALVFLYIRFLN